MTSYILAVCGAVLIATIVTILLPEGNTGKFINGILRLFCVFVLMLPIYHLITQWREDGFSPTTNGKIELDSSFLEYNYAIWAEEREKQIKSTVENEFKITVTVELQWTYAREQFIVQKVCVKIEDFGIIDADEHIYTIEQVQQRVQKMVQTEVVVYVK